MLKQERQKMILDMIRKQQNVKSSELQEYFKVSDETIRRDLMALEKQGLLRCVHGGAVYVSPTTNEYHIEVRIHSHQMEKEAICREAARLISEGESVAIGASTTTVALGTFLKEKNNLTVVTNSLLLANQISQNETNQVHLVGGKIWIDHQKTMGMLAVEDFCRFRVDKTLFSIAGITADGSMTDYSEEETAITRALLKIGRTNIMLGDVSKFHTIALRHIGDIDSIHHIVSDWNVPWSDLKPFEEKGIHILRVQK